MSLQISYDNVAAKKEASDRQRTERGLSTKWRHLAGKAFNVLFTKRNSLFAFVVIPSVVSAFYYFMVASSQYITEIRMVVRTIGVSERFDSSEKRSGRSIIGGDSLTQDAYIVANYLRSPQIVRLLEAKLDLRDFYSKSDIDPLSRLRPEASFEDLHKYWNRHVDTYVDGPSGIIVLTVRAFSPEDAALISGAALAASNEMIDKISEKAKSDLVSRAEADVLGRLEQYRVTLDELREFQNQTGILDPLSAAKMEFAIIAKLTAEKLKLEVDLKSLESADASNTPRGRQIRRSIQALDDQIKLRQNSIAGTDTSVEHQLSNSLTEFSRLETKKLVSETLYKSTVRNLDTARSTALKRTTFISVFSDSMRPEDSTYPDRLSEWIILTAGLFTLWMTATLIWMSIEDHRV
ncbi:MULTISPECIES: hypothetical protein [unclassified Ensifer]|uniref:hypothetical protein n=1 Tax=unclassified Ensifer TaxID=2633371 RepID=UPI00300F996F